MTLIDIDGCRNFRDVGGLPTSTGGTVRSGRVYRSSQLSQISAGGLGTLRTLGIRTEIDLRGAGEAAPGDSTRLGHGTRYLNLPFLPPQAPAADDRAVIGADGIRAGQYAWIARAGTGTIRTVFEVLADPASHPVLVHCRHGWGRTGIVVALLLDAIGVPAPEIADEYVRTQLALDSLTDAERSVAPWVEVQPEALARVGPLAAGRAHRDSIIGFFAEIRRRNGSTRAFLTGPCEIPEKTIEQVESLLVAHPAGRSIHAFSHG